MVNIPIFLSLYLCDYLISTDSNAYAGVCVGNRSYRHDPNTRKIGRHKKMSPTCRDDIFDMSATDTNVCRLRGGADRHKSRHCQPRRQGQQRQRHNDDDDDDDNDDNSDNKYGGGCGGGGGRGGRYYTVAEARKGSIRGITSGCKKYIMTR